MLNKSLYISSYLFIILVLTACSGSGGGGSSVGTGAVSYYVDATSGLDTNNGLTQASAWKTLNKVSNTSFTKKSEILLKRGETWNESLTISNNDITVDAYGSGALPILDGAIDSNFVIVATGIYAPVTNIVLATDERLGNVSKDGEMMKFLAWDTDYTTTLGAAATDSYTYDNASGIIYIKPASLSNPYQVSKKISGITAKNLTDIAVNNVSVLNYSLHGIQFENCTRCKVENSTIKNIGGAVVNLTPPLIYAGNGIEFANSSKTGEVSNVTVSDIFDSCLTVQTFESNQAASDFTISNSTLSKCGFAGIEISVLSNGGTTGSTLDNVTLSGLTIQTSGKGWSGQRYGTEGNGIRIKADSSAGTISGVTITSSEITTSINNGISLAGQSNVVTLRKLKIHTNDQVGILLQDGSATNLKLDLATSLIYDNGSYGIHYNSLIAAGLSIIHNSFVNNSTSVTPKINMAISNQANTAKIQNNLFYSSTDPLTHLYAPNGLVGVTLDNNCYNDRTNMFNYSGDVYSTVATFRTGKSFEINGVGDLIAADFTNAGSSDFTLTGGSACESIGLSGTGIIKDYVDTTYASPPSSGAYQYVP